MEKKQTTGWLFSLVILYSCLHTPALAEIYKWVDADGNVHFSDQQSGKQNARPVELKSTINSYNGSSLPKFEYSPPAKKKTTKPAKAGKLPKLRKGQVIMYSTVWCGYCKKAKAYFKQKGISFSERDIEKSKQAEKEYRSLGGGGVPLILVGGKQGTQRLSGFSVTRFDNAYR